MIIWTRDNGGTAEQWRKTNMELDGEECKHRLVSALLPLEATCSDLSMRRGKVGIAGMAKAFSKGPARIVDQKFSRSPSLLQHGGHLSQ